MILFLAIYILLYGGMHFWMTHNLLHAYTFPPIGRWGLILWMTLMVILPVMLAVLERKHLVAELTRSISWLAFTWMGVLFLMLMSFLFVSLLQSGLNGLFHLGNWQIASWVFTQGFKMTVTLLLVAAITLFAFWEASHVRIEKIVLKTSKREASSNPLRIVQISDLHLGTIIREDYLHKITEKIKLLKPDIIVSTGDLVDAPLDANGELVTMFNALHAPLGKFAIMGNHEYIAGVQSSLGFIKASGFELLRDEKHLLPNGVVVAGVEDPSGKYFDKISMVSEKELLNSNSNAFHLLLKHRPVIANESKGLFDLQLSGHTHKGQLFPFNIFTRMAFRYNSGLYEINPKQWLYVSRGTGTWGPPMRWMAPPEITVIDILGEP